MDPSSTTAPSVTRRARLSRALALTTATLAVAYLATLAVVSRPAFHAALRDRIERLLRARVGEVVVGQDLRVDPLFRVTFGPVTIPGTRPSDAPVVRVGQVRVRARLAALLLGRLEAASVRIEDVRIEAGPGGRALSELAARLPRRTPRRGPLAAGVARAPADDADDRDDPAVSVRGLVARAVVAGRAVELGPVAAELRRLRDDGGERVDGSLALPGGGRGTVSVRRGATGWSGEARLDGVGPAALPELAAELPVTLSSGALSLEASGEAPADAGRGRVHARLGATGVVLAGERMGAEPVGPLDLAASGTIEWDATERRMSLRDGAVTLPGGLDVALAAEARLGPGVPFSFTARADGVDFDRVVAALPPGLGLPADAPHPAGTLDARLTVSGPLLAPAAWDVTATLDLGRMREVARRAPPVAERAPFTFRPEVERGPAPAIEVGPRSPDFVPFAELPVHVVRAVTASEDGGFFAHEGFDFEELRNAFAAGAEQGRVVRGGSTITQQLAKNLYLSREKTVARKVREAAVTIALEATVPKHRLLEIYLNVAEWGPGIWGIGPAARHWFGKDARALTPKEAAFLATVIPNPVRYHVLWDRGALTDAWEQRVHELLLKMRDQGAITDEELADALSEWIVFHRPDAVANP